MNILATGANGQLGGTLSALAATTPHTFYFASRQEIDITNEHSIKAVFKRHRFDFCINCAAYTAVDKAEKQSVLAHAVNAKGVAKLARCCSIYNVTLIHISTDFVFDGSKIRAYKETDATNPLNVYGKTKLAGEELALKEQPASLIIRTSWLYSAFGQNFVDTMLRLSRKKSRFTVVSDQIGTPTYALDLARTIILIIEKMPIDRRNIFGIYHYSNEGIASWYDFAAAIFEYTHTSVELYPVSTEKFPRPAVRPSFSMMDKNKIKENFNIKISYWRESLKAYLTQIKRV